MVAARARINIALAHTVHERRVVDQSSGHLHQLEALVQHALNPAARHQPADIHQRTLQLAAETLGVLQKEALLEVVLLIIHCPKSDTTIFCGHIFHGM